MVIQESNISVLTPRETDVLKSRLEYIYPIILLFFILPPGIVEYVPYRDTIVNILNAGKVLVALMSFLYTSRKGNVDWIIIYSWCFFIALTTFYNFGRYTYLMGYIACIIDGLFSGFFIFNNKNGIKTIYYYCLVLTVLYFLSIILFPEGIISATDDRFIRAKEVWVYGLYSQATPMIILSMGILLSKRAIKKNNILDLFLLISILGSALLINCGTLKTGLLFFVLFYIYVRKKEKFNYILFGIAILTTVCIIASIGFSYISFYVEDVLGKDMTATGRTYIWSFAIDTILKSPLFGYGIRDSDWMYETISASHCHDYYLNLLLEGGLIHLSCFIYVVTKAFRSFNALKEKKIMLGIVCGVIAMLICFLAEAYSYRFCCSFYLMIGILLNFQDDSHAQTQPSSVFQPQTQPPQIYPQTQTEHDSYDQD